MHIAKILEKYGRTPALFDIEKVREYLQENKLGFIVDVRFRPSDETILLYVPQELIYEKTKKKFTSTRQLEFIKKKIKSVFKKDTEVIITQSEDHFELEVGVYQILNRKYDDKIISLYLSFSGENRVNIWIEAKDVNDELRKDIEEHLSSILAEANIVLDTTSWVSIETELPTLTFLLRELKICQPIDLNGFLALLNNSYPSISDKWLKRKLDQLRKKGFLRRQCNGSFVLTAMGVASTPAGARYTSSDIGRALALGRKKW